MSIFNKLRDDIIIAAGQIYNDEKLLKSATVEIPKDNLNGDLSSNIAMIIASKQNNNPKEGVIMKRIDSSTV